MCVCVWAEGVLLVCRDAVGVFYSLNQLGSLLRVELVGFMECQPLLGYLMPKSDFYKQFPVLINHQIDSYHSQHTVTWFQVFLTIIIFKEVYLTH